MRAAFAWLVALAGCGGSAAFQLTADDNDPEQLGAALASRDLGGGRAPTAADGHARVVAVVSGTPRRLVAYDLTAGTTAWSVDADVQSRVVFGGDVVAAVEGRDVVARELGTGAVRWRAAVGGTFGGIAADADGVYVVRHGDGAAPRSWLTAYAAGDGKQRWSADAEGTLGAPAAQGGLVFSPFVKQWLSVLDARTGKQRARIRGVDEEIGFVQTTSDAAWFGSSQGVFRLDERAASGRRDQATYGKVTLPTQLATARYAPDGYDPVQAGYSAADRARVLWRGDARASGPLSWQDNGWAVHYFRFVLGYDAAGALRWAYSHPRVELVTTIHLGSVLLGVSASGEVVALDPARGVVRHRAQLDLGDGQVLGAGIDADGWMPPGAGDDAADTVAALVAIARDRDKRFERVKELAISALAKLPGPAVTADLLALLDDERTSDKLKDLVGDVLVERRDPTGLPALLAALGRRDDAVDDVTAGPVGVLARAIGSLGEGLDDDGRRDAAAALLPHLRAPALELGDLLDVIGALGAIAHPSATAGLRAHLLLYRVDPDLTGSAEWVTAITGALVRHGTPEAREALRFVGADARTEPPLAMRATEAASARR